MGSEPVIDVDALLAPISEDSPTGPELDRAAPSLDAVVTCRDQAKTAERRQREAALFDDEGGEPIPDPEWGKLVALSAELLKNESKDLRVAAWLTEGLLRENGFAGLRDGLRVCRGLCSEQFWEHIHPAPDEFDGHEMTVAQFGGLAGDASLIPVSEIPLTATPAGEYYSMADYAVAADLESVTNPGARERKMQDGAVNFDTIENAVRATPAEFYHALVDDLQEIVTLLNEISTFLDVHCKPNQYDEPSAPSVSTLRNRVSEILELVQNLARHHLEAPPEAVEASAGGELITADGAAPAQQVAKMASAKVVSREDAFEAMLKIADFFERTEPHSPLSYAIRQVVNWGNMSLTDLLKDLINDRGTREEISRRVGVPDLNE